MAETDLISRQAAIDAIEDTDWYHQNASEEPRESEVNNENNNIHL